MPPPLIRATPRIWFNPSLKTPPFMIPGVMTILLVITTTLVTAMGLAREREMGTLEQVLVTPIRPLFLLVGKMTPFLVIGCFDVLLVLTAGVWIFGVPLHGSLLLVATGTVLYVLSTLGIGLLISTVSRTQQQAFLAGFLFAMPAILLSGVMTPIRAMPFWLQVVTFFNPVRYYIEVLRAVLFKGAGLFDIWWRLLALLGFGLALLTVASLRFRKRVGVISFAAGRTAGRILASQGHQPHQHQNWHSAIRSGCGTLQPAVGVGRITPAATARCWTARRAVSATALQR